MFGRRLFGARQSARTVRCEHGETRRVDNPARLEPLCTQGDINEALLYATLSLVGTHAVVWISRD
jgi:hypothetical protein